MKIIDCIQQTPDWYMHRKGIPTAGCFSRIIQSELETKSITNTNKNADKVVVVDFSRHAIQTQLMKPTMIGDHVVINPGETVTTKEKGKFLLKPGGTLIATGGIKPSASLTSYIAELITESKFIAPATWIGNEHTERGNMLEPDAREAYEFMYDKKVEQVGFCLTDDERYGCSPDGFIDDRKGGVEIKCPKIEIHIEYVMKNRLPPAYAVQVHGNMFVTGAEYWDFVSYAEGCELFVLRIERDDFTEKLGTALDEFWPKLVEAREKFGVGV